MATFTWLHLTDLHCGQKGQSWRWPTVRDIVRNDLEKLYHKTGVWDLVLFTGDLAFSGQPDEYATVNTVLNELWEQFDKLGFNPPLLPVPGNHDLVWPADPMHPAVRPFLKWSGDREFQEYFWNTPDSDYHNKLNELFTNYLHWRDNQPNIPKDLKIGLLPGDFAFTLEKEDARLGVLGLNTAFLQLSQGDYTGKLALHTQQFHAACGNLDGPAWAGQHQTCLLLTHHPPEWLDEQSRTHFDEEIFAHNRFVAHLCGHLHETRSLVTSEAGTEPRRRWQGKSLFGLETYAGQEQRLHGYAVGQLTLQGGKQAELTFWPREAKKQGAQRSIVPDYSVALTDDQHIRPLECQLLIPYQASPEQQPEVQAGEQSAPAPPAGVPGLDVPNDLRQQITDLLTSLDAFHDTPSQKAFIVSAGLDDQLQQRIQYNRPSGEFATLLVETLRKYGTLADGRQALEAVLHAAKDYGGQEIQDTCEALIRSIQDLSGFRQPELLKPDRSDLNATRLREVYLERLLQKVGYVPLAEIDPQTPADEPEARRNLDAIYTALLTLSQEEHERFRKGEAIPEKRKPALAQLDEHQHLVLLGDPGSGKSTFVNFVTMCLAGEWLQRPDINLELLKTPLPPSNDDKEPQPQPWRHGQLLPVRIVLREFAAEGLPADDQPVTGNHVWNHIVNDLTREGFEEFAPYLKQHLWDHGGLILFDGLDEVPETDRVRSQIKHAVEGCMGLFSKCRLLVTSRTYAYQRREWKLAGCAKAVLSTFTGAQIRHFVARWYAYLAGLRGADKQEYEHKAEDLSGRILSKPRLKDLARRPLLLTLMTSLDASRGNLPEKRIELYQETVGLLLHRWEWQKIRRRNKSGHLVSERQSLLEWLDVDRNKVLELLGKLAYEAHLAHPEDQEGTAAIEEAKLLVGLKHLSKAEHVTLETIEAHLRDRAGLLISPDGVLYTFPHRSFQEYLAACHLYNQKTYPKNIAPLAREHPNHWREVVLLAAALGPPRDVWALIKALCPAPIQERQTSVPDAWGAVFSGQALTETTIDLEHPDDEEQKEIDRIRNWLEAILTEQAPAGEPLPAVERALAGNILAVLDDTRPGVGVGENGLPDIEWRQVPAGTFLMGSSAEEIEGVKELYKVIEFVLEWEQPQHNVSLSAYQISRYPVTNAQYQAFVEDGGYTEKSYWTQEGWKEVTDKQITGPERYGGTFDLPNHPVVGVSWYEATAFCAWLTLRLRESRVIGAHELIGLPTEAQWEKAARGDDGRMYPWGDEPVTPEQTNYADTGLGVTSAVGCFPRGAGPYGCEEMVGNVWEWCWDWFDENYYEHSAKENSQGPESGSSRVVRGGSWANFAGYCRAAYRYRAGPDVRFYDLGFRLLRTPA